MANRYTQVYTDGACSGNGRSEARAGVGVYFGENDPRNVSEPVYGRQTNIEAEIGAARRGIEVARQSGERSVQINTDSEFLVKSHNDWMPKWQQNGWKTSSGAEVKNRESFQRLNEAKQGMDVKFNYVPAHSGVHGNERADQLARHGARKY